MEGWLLKCVVAAACLRTWFGHRGDLQEKAEPLPEAGQVIVLESEVSCEAAEVGSIPTTCRWRDSS